MLNLKKTAVAVLALGSSTVFAGTMGPVCAPGNVTVPCERTAWDVGAQALYLQPTYSGNLGYLNSVGVAGVNTTLDTIQPNWGWGFQIEGSYHFNTGNDFDVNWYHLNDSTKKSFVAGPIAGEHNVRPQWDAINFELGQHVDFSDMKSLRLHGGLQYARISNRIILNNYLTTGTGFDKATYNGFGPRFGGDMNYDIGNGFSVYGKGAASLLIGTAKDDVTGYVVNPLYNSYISKTTMVPELEGKIGAKYNFSMAQGDLGLDVGYMWVNYFQSLYSVTAGPKNSPVAPSFSRLESSNFGLNGLYFGLKWVGNV